MNSHKSKAAGFTFLMFSSLVLGISALTSFSFFYTYFGSLIPEGVLDPTIRALLSGLIGMLLFDVAAVIWLFTFLHHSETSEQRAISLTMTIVTFTGAAAASIAYLSLQAQGEMQLGATTRETIGMIALITVIGGIIANFGSAQAHHRFSLENKASVAESDRRDVLQQAEDEQAKFLDSLIAQNVKEKLSALAPGLAQEQAEKLASRFYTHESSKYARGAKNRQQETAGKVVQVTKFDPPISVGMDEEIEIIYNPIQPQKPNSPNQ